VIRSGWITLQPPLRRHLSAALVLMLSTGTVQAACRTDGDCQNGTVCLFSRGRDDGACAKPQQRIALPNDAQDITVPLRNRTTTGAACQFTPDCLPGYRCYKRGGEVHGVCLRPQ